MIPCSNCNIGQMRKTYITYFTWLGDQMITVPDFPAWICDMCGRREYDMQALDNLAMLLFPPTEFNRVRTQQKSTLTGKTTPINKRMSGLK